MFRSVAVTAAIDRKGVIMAKDNKKLPAGITQRKDGRLMGQFTVDGHRHVLYIKPGESIKAFSDRVSDTKYEIKFGLKGKTDSNIKLDQYFSDIWLPVYKKPFVKYSTYNHFQSYYRIYIKSTLGNKKLKDVQNKHIQMLYNKLADKGIATNTIKKVHNIMHNLFKTATADKIIFNNPADNIMIPKIKPKKRRALTKQEQAKFLEFVNNSVTWHRYYCLFYCLFFTGMRIGEALALRWDDIDYNSSIISVNKTLEYLQDQETKKCHYVQMEPKTETSNRQIPMVDELSQLFKEHYKDQVRYKNESPEWHPLDDFNNMVFVSYKGTPIPSCTVNRVITSIVKDINKKEKAVAVEEKRDYEEFKNFTPHECRHTFATNCIESGIPLKVLQEYLGHATLSMTSDLYSHVQADFKMDEIKKLQRRA